MDELAFAFTALALAALGIFGVMSYMVVQRSREIGIRIALGADARRVVRMFFGSGVRTALLGLALGVPASVGALALAANMFGTDAGSVASSGIAVSVAVLAVAALASWLPARRAARVDAIVALRSE